MARLEPVQLNRMRRAASPVALDCKKERRSARFRWPLPAISRQSHPPTKERWTAGPSRGLHCRTIEGHKRRAMHPFKGRTITYCRMMPSSPGTGEAVSSRAERVRVTNVERTRRHPHPAPSFARTRPLPSRERRRPPTCDCSPRKGEESRPRLVRRAMAGQCRGERFFPPQSGLGDGRSGAVDRRCNRSATG